MEEEKTNYEQKQLNGTRVDSKHLKIFKTLNNTQSTDAVAYKDNKKDLSFSITNKGKSDSLKPLKKTPTFIKTSLKDLYVNNKENIRKKINSNISRSKTDEYMFGNKSSVDRKSLRSPKNSEISHKFEIKNVLNGKNISDVKKNLNSTNVYDESVKQNTSLIPNIYEHPIHEKTDICLEEKTNNPEGEVKIPIFKNKNIYEKKATKNNSIDSSLDVSKDSVLAPTSDITKNEISFKAKVLNFGEVNHQIEENLSEISSRSMNLNSFEDTFLSTDIFKNKSSVALKSKNQTFMSATTSTTPHELKTINPESKQKMVLNNTKSETDIVYPKCKTINQVKFVSANTNRGSFRNYNEDRISIVLNIKGNENVKYSYFGVFDGHAGPGCSEFLKETLHKYIIAQKNLFDDFETNIAKTFKVVDNLFKEKALSKSDRSGSCALTMFFNNGEISFANVGDSRGIASLKNGAEIKALTIDHKPENTDEKERVFENGGYFYATNTVILKKDGQKMINGPLRVFPGKLTTTRSFGDFEAKLPHFGGVEGVVISEPEIFTYNSDEMDFIVLGCDGLYENITNQEIMDFIHEELNQLRRLKKLLTKDVSDSITKKLVDYVIEHGSSDNVSAVLIFFDKFVNTFESEIH